MQTVLYSKLKKEDCIKSLKEAGLKTKKEFLDNNALGLIYTELEGDTLRAERFLLIPRLFKPVFIGKLQEEGSLTKISGCMGLSPQMRALSSMAFLAWSVLAIVISLLASQNGQVLGHSVAEVMGGAIIAGVLLFLAAPRIAAKAQQNDENLILDYLRKAIDVKAII